jgi:hypothetical protein
VLEYWSTEVLEYWSVGVLRKLMECQGGFPFISPVSVFGFPLLHYSDTPTLQKSIELGRTVAPLWGENKATSFGRRFFTG